MNNIVKRKEMFIIPILILQLLLVVLVCNHFSSKTEPIKSIKKGKFEIRNTDYVCDENILLIYSSGSVKAQKGKKIFSSTQFFHGNVYLKKNNEEMVGCYCPNTVSKDDHIVFQFEACSQKGQGSLKYSIAGEEGTVVIDERPQMFFIPITEVKKIGDIYFMCNEVEQVILDKLFLINYKSIPYEQIFLGNIYSEKLGVE